MDESEMRMFYKVSAYYNEWKHISLSTVGISSLNYSDGCQVDVQRDEFYILLCAFVKGGT